MGNSQDTYYSNTEFCELGFRKRKPPTDDGWWIHSAMSMTLSICVWIFMGCVKNSSAPSPPTRYEQAIGIGSSLFNMLAYNGKETRMGASGLCSTCNGAGTVCYGHKQVNDDSIFGFCLGCGGIGRVGCYSCGGSGRSS